MTDETQEAIDKEELMRMTTDIVASFLSNNLIPSENLPAIIKSVHATMTEISSDAVEPEPKTKPAVPISKSITQDHIICLEDGKKLKMLKRYLRSQFGMTPDEYKRKWGLPSDYPMVAPAYSKRRSVFAKEIGLGKAGGRRKNK